MSIREPDPATQNGRVLAWMRAHPGASVVECYDAMQPRISNIRARHSDLRALGFVIVCERRPDGHDGFAVVPVEEQHSRGLAVA